MQEWLPNGEESAITLVGCWDLGYMGPTVGNLSFLIMGRAGGSVDGQQGRQAPSTKLHNHTGRKASTRLPIVFQPYLLDQGHNIGRLFLLMGSEKPPARRSCWRRHQAPREAASGGGRGWTSHELNPGARGWRHVRPARAGGHTAPVALHRRSAEVRLERSHEGTTSSVQARPWCFGEGPTGHWPDEHGCGQCPVGGLHGGRYGR